jgi:hypothetical protein
VLIHRGGRMTPARRVGVIGGSPVIESSGLGKLGLRVTHLNESVTAFRLFHRQTHKR